MNNITSKSSQDRAASQINAHKPVESVETAGSLAMASKSLFSTNVYDVFSSSNPFAVDYTQYASVGNQEASSSNFLSNFSSAVSVLGGADCSGASVSSGSASSGGSCSSSSSSFIC
mgnify:CR=1 FL=1